MNRKKLFAVFFLVFLMAAFLNTAAKGNDNIKDIFIELPETDDSPKELKQNALQVMNELKETPEVKENENNLEKVNTIISLIEESLLEEHWWTEEFAKDGNVFRLEKEAAQQIRVLYDREKPDEVNKEKLVQALALLVKADERIAKKFIEIAESAMPVLEDYDIELYNEVNTALANANEYYDKAFWHIKKGDPVVSIEFFRQAWAEINDTVVALDAVTIPEITIENPVDGSFTNQPSQTISGSVFDVLIFNIIEAQLTVNGSTQEISLNNGLFSQGVTLTEGANTITVEATDLFNNTGTGSITVVLDTIPPAVSVLSPVDSSFVRQSIQADAQVIELNLEKTELIIDNVVVSNSFPFGWDTTAETDGPHSISFAAVDKAGNQTTKTIQVNVDNTAPDLFVEELNVNPTLDESDYYLLGAVKDNFGIQSFKINGANTTISNDSFEFDTTIIEGENNFDFIAIDLAGNESSYHITKLIDADDLPDFYETNVLKTDPLDADSDSLETTADESDNGVNDDIEDFDSDGLSNLQEYVVGSDPFNSDTDGDSLDDYFEVFNSETDPLNPDSDEDGVNDDSADDDDDGLTNIEEQTFGTNALSDDSDQDLLSDFDEVNIYNSNPVSVDSDDDALADESEVWLGTNLLNSDSDGDGLVDSEEFYLQTLPMNGKGIEVEINAKGDARNTVFEEVDLQEHSMLSEIPGTFRPIELIVTNDFTQAKVKIFYDESKLSDSKASEILVTYFNEQTHGLELMDDFEINTTDNFIKFTTNHASNFIPIVKSDFLSSFDFSNWNIQWQPAENVFSAGQAVTVKANVSNTTITSASNAKVEFRENSLSGTTVATKTISGISGNSSVQTSINYTIGFNVDRICVITDSDNSISEEDEGDNAACKLFPGKIDSDGDGLTDEEESNGMRVSFPFKTIRTDHLNADSDGDGLTDGEEMGVVITDTANYELYVLLTGNTSQTYYGGKHFKMISDPTKKDSDGDEINDKEEIEKGLNPLKYEADNEFMMGIVLGEIGLDNPKHQNLSFMSGFIVGGAIPIYEWLANARDAIYLTYKGDYGGAGLNVGFLAFGVGLTATGVGVEAEDVPEAAIKAAKAVKKVPSLLKPFSRILVDKFETLGKVPVVGDSSIHILDAVYDGKVALLKSKGISEEAIKGFAKQQVHLGKVDDYLNDFKKVKGYPEVAHRIKYVGEAGAAFEAEVAVTKGVDNVKQLGGVPDEMPKTVIFNGEPVSVDFDVILKNGRFIEAKSGKQAAENINKIKYQALHHKKYMEENGIKELEYVFSHKPTKEVRDFLENLGFIVTFLE